MKIVNSTPLPCAMIAGRMPFPGHSLTLVVKGTFDLVPGGVAKCAEEPLFPTGDEHYADDEEMTGSLRYESDFAYFKPRADLLLVGKAHAPGGRSVERLSVGFRVGTTSRSLAIVADPDEEGRFSEMDLRYENSHGGAKYPANPVGRGHRAQVTASGSSRKLPPTVTDPERSGRGQEPAGFAPIGRMWKARAGKLGKYNKKWTRERWPWFPTDFDWSHYNAAPGPMQLEGYLRGDEEIALDNLHADHAHYQTHLPGLRVRCFLDVSEDVLASDGDNVALREVSMNLDTLWIDAEAEKLVLVWRGWTEVRSPDFDEVEHVLIASEELSESPRPIEHYRDVLLAELAPPEELAPREPDLSSAEVDADEEAQLAQAMETNRETLGKLGIDPDNPPPRSEEDLEREARILAELGLDAEAQEDPPWTRARVQQAAAAGESLGELDLKGLDLSELDLSNADMKGALLAGANLEGANLAGVDLTGASLPKANLADANLQGALLAQADLTGADAARADLSGADLCDAYFEGACLVEARLPGVQAKGCSFSGAQLTSARLDEGEFSGSDFSRSVLDGAVFKAAQLARASFDGAHGHAADFSGAILTEAQISDGADFSSAIFRGASAVETIWESATLEGADFSHACLDGADFTSAKLQRSNFHGASMKYARFMGADLSEAKLIRVNLFRGSLERALLEGANLDGSNLYGVDFLDALVEDAQLGSADVTMTRLD